MKRKKINQKNAIRDLSMFFGLPPYDGAGNLVNADSYFANSIEEKYEMTISELREAVGFNALMAHWNRMRNDFLDKADAYGYGAKL